MKNLQLLIACIAITFNFSAQIPHLKIFPDAKSDYLIHYQEYIHLSATRFYKIEKIKGISYASISLYEDNTKIKSTTIDLHKDGKRLFIGKVFLVNDELTILLGQNKEKKRCSIYAQRMDKDFNRIGNFIPIFENMNHTLYEFTFPAFVTEKFKHFVSDNHEFIGYVILSVSKKDEIGQVNYKTFTSDYTNTANGSFEYKTKEKHWKKELTQLTDKGDLLSVLLSFRLNKRGNKINDRIFEKITILNLKDQIEIFKEYHVNDVDKRITDLLFDVKNDIVCLSGMLLSKRKHISGIMNYKINLHNLSSQEFEYELTRNFRNHPGYRMLKLANNIIVDENTNLFIFQDFLNQIPTTQRSKFLSEKRTLQSTNSAYIFKAEADQLTGSQTIVLNLSSYNSVHFIVAPFITETKDKLFLIHNVNYQIQKEGQHNNAKGPMIIWGESVERLAVTVYDIETNNIERKIINVEGKEKRSVYVPAYSYLSSDKESIIIPDIINKYYIILQ